MAETYEHWNDLTADLKTLRTLFPKSEAGATALRCFDDFLSEYEMDLALHVVCDFLLEPEAPPASKALQSQLQRLHSKLEIEDDCVSRLLEKSKNPSAG
jgi:hypothetical protein